MKKYKQHKYVSLHEIKTILFLQFHPHGLDLNTFFHSVLNKHGLMELHSVTCIIKGEIEEINL